MTQFFPKSHLFLIVFLFIIVLFGCKKETDKEVSKGMWRAELLIDKSIKIPFTFEVHEKNKWSFYNAEEVISVDEITYDNDSVRIQFPVYEGYIIAKMSDTVLNGNFIKPSLDRIVPFRATYGKQKRFTIKGDPKQNVSGNWEAVFSDDCDCCRYVAKGIFKQVKSVVQGTFRTTTGDYRYLEGVVDGDSLKLSTFDGAHAFLFEAIVKDSVIEGTFYSGNHFKEPFYAKRNESYELPNEDSLTFLKKGFKRFFFEFPNKNGDRVSLDDDQFKNKVVIVQIMGSWCPNCLDETKYYSAYAKQKAPKDAVFVALAFEYAKTKEKAFANLQRLEEKIKIPYPILLAQFGTSDKKEAQKKLPMLNHILSYPTTVILDKKGQIRKIHTGFNGPATGDKYKTFKKEFESFVELLASESN
ncbi:peroxiredoxin family protein [Flavobacteriaceae bacterium M23B6Z8]